MYKIQNCYYLLYKLNNYHLLWVVNIDNIPDHFLEFIKNVKSKHETYYLIKKKVYNLEQEISNFKRFTIFSNEKNCQIIKQTERRFFTK